MITNLMFSYSAVSSSFMHILFLNNNKFWGSNKFLKTKRKMHETANNKCASKCVVNHNFTSYTALMA